VSVRIVLPDFVCSYINCFFFYSEQGIETRRNIINLIFDKLIQGTTPDIRIKNFCDTVKIRKGRDLLRRVFPILFKVKFLDLHITAPVQMPS
jgi:hypothetical protein